MVPIDLSTLFEKTDTRLPGNGKPYLYTRLGNPTRSALETQVASIFQKRHAVAANSIQSAYYALSLLLDSEADEILVLSASPESPVGDLVRQVYGEGPQSFRVTLAPDIPQALARVREGRIRMVIADRVQVSREEITVLSDEALGGLHEACRDLGVMLVVDISRAYPVVLGEKAEMRCCDYMIGDLSMMAGVEGYSGAVIMSEDAER